MQAPKSLRRPSNWQDFESLCKKLWGEIWKCPEIQKNGRMGQRQCGVDIYGVPKDERGYYGIQCKGKDEYSQKQFTENEVDAEIEKAKQFIPPLLKFYFATTAQKDVAIEAYVRQKHIEHLSAGLFGVYLYSWEDIVERIDENQETHDYYVNSQNYRSSSSVSFTFENEEESVSLKPVFLQERNIYRLKGPAYIDEKLDSWIRLTSHTAFFGAVAFANRPQINRSFVSFQLKLKNTGSTPLEDYKVLLEFTDDVVDLQENNMLNDFPTMISLAHYSRTTYLYAENKAAKLIPRSGVLVGDDTFISAEIFVKPSPTASSFGINWKLLSKNFKAFGKLTVLLFPEIKFKNNTFDVDNEAMERIERGAFEDYLEDKD